MNILEKAKTKFSKWYSPQTAPSNDFRIAIFSPSTKGIAKGIKSGFIKRIENQTSQPVSFHAFDATSGESSTIVQNLDRIHHQRYDLLFTIGRSCTKSAVAYFRNLHSKVPIVCSAIPQNMFETTRVPRNLTGVTAETIDRKPEHLQKYFLIRPSSSHVLFLYNYLENWAQEHCQAMEQTAEKNRKYFSKFNAKNFSAHKFIDLVSSSFPRIDTVLLSRDLQTQAIAKQVAELCNNLNVTLMSFDAYSVQEGASLGFSPTEELSGEEAADKALLILKDKVHTSQLSLSSTHLKYKLMINSNTMHRQNLTIDSKILLAMKHLEIA